MHLKSIGATALLWVYAAGSFAVPIARAPEIDGALSMQVIGLLAGVVYLMKRNK